MCCSPSCGRQHSYPLISVHGVGNDSRTALREAPPQSPPGAGTSSRNSQALSPLITALCSFSVLPQQLLALPGPAQPRCKQPQLSLVHEAEQPLDGAEFGPVTLPVQLQVANSNISSQLAVPCACLCLPHFQPGFSIC